MTVPRILRWLVTEDPAPQEFHAWDEDPARTQEIPVVTAKEARS